MAHILKLPLEIQLEIYRCINNIDDALHLARTCKLLNFIFEAPSNRLNILTCIIQNGQHHEFDVWLHSSETRYATFAGGYDNGQTPDLYTRPLFQDQLRICPEREKLSAETVWSIVCRWHAMKALFDLYCDSTTRPYYLRSLLPYQPGTNESSRWDMALAYEIPLPPPSCHAIDSLGIAEKHRAYERFYRALCSHWVMVNELWLARISRYRTSSMRNDAFETIWTYWLDHPARNLREKVETIEVVDYVWGFLGRKIFWNPDQLSEWLHGQNAADEFLDVHESVAGNWLYFVRYVAQYLRPPQIIELLNDMWNPRRRPFDKGKYIHGLGFFDTSSREGFPEIDESVGSPEAFFALNLIEADGMDRLIGGDSGGFHENQWEKYRYSRWINDLRGQVLLSSESNEQLLQRFRN